MYHDSFLDEIIDLFEFRSLQSDISFLDWKYEKHEDG